MTGMVLAALAGYVVSQAALVLLTWRDPLLRESRAESSAMSLSWVLFGGVAIWRGTLATSLPETLFGLALTGVVVLVITVGRPVLVMLDGLNLSHLPVQERRRLRRRGRAAQGLLIAAIVAVVVWLG